MTSAQSPIFDNSYAKQAERFFSPQAPTTVPAPALIRINTALAAELGIDPQWLASPEGIATMAGNHIPDGAEPIATVYAGHQFGGWNPQLGDGRAVLLGELIGKNGTRYDWQLKGSGRTPYSRGGDGKSPIGPVLREYILCEAMAALKVPTTRALGAVSSGELVFRDQALPGAVFSRVAQSHIRVGTMQFFASRRDTEALQELSDYLIQRHFPDAAQASNPVLAMLDEIIARQATLIAKWQSIGFIHGVMNTDNMLLCGETIDYGPCAFMDSYDPATVFSSIDHNGRYAYGNQPGIAHWNLAQLAQALLAILDNSPDANEDSAVALAQQALDAFPELFLKAYQDIIKDKLGLSRLTEQDDTLYQDLLKLMEAEKADFTLCFRRLAELADEGACINSSVRELFEFNDSFTPWLQQWRQRLTEDTQTAAERQAHMFKANPVFIPRNHLVQEAITAAERNNDLSVFNQLVDVLKTPHTFDPAKQRYALPPKPNERVLQTFCGT
ncbi:YdiU family protein [uncultured Zhongshania sp.]|uniref:protein adenylyltransferase SelO n=1 Tax=uncultured Zhongshania sp. TaxID=1642288 RepID=UPI0025CC56FF|nr:YdiU family protein [uncultured Zhongshania sp.]